MFSLKKYFRKRRSSCERVPSELTCTCPNLNNGGVAERRVASVEDMDRRGAPSEGGGGGHKSWNRFRRDESSIFPSIAAKTRFFASKCQGEDENANPSGYRSYRRSISLGQILNSDGTFGSPGRGGGGGVGIPGGGGGGRGVDVGHPYLPGSPVTSPIEDGGGRELSDFEKENLLFLKDLDNSYHRPLSDDLDNSFHRPLSHSLSNTSLGSTFSEDSLTEDSTPRGGSPYPGRREFPRTTYSPSKTVVDPRILRSVSREEPESESSDRESLHGSRKISLPIMRRTEHRSHSSGPSSLPDSHGAWWNSGHVRETLDRAPSTNQNRSFENARRLFTNRSLSSPGEVSSRPSEKVAPVSNVAEVGRRRWVRASSSTTSPSIVNNITNNNNNNNNTRNNNNSKKTNGSPFKNNKSGNNNNNKDAATRSLAHLTEATPAAGKTAAPPADLPCPAAAAGTTVGGTAAANSSSSSSTPHKSIPSSSTPTTPSTTPGDTSSLTPPSSSTSNAVVTASGASPSGTTASAAASAAKNGEGEETGTASTLADSSSGGSSGSSSSSGSSTKRPQGQPMAFTIDLGDEAEGASSDNNKKLDISDSIRKWAPRHRRNLSLTKVDENKKVEEKVGKPPMGRPRSGTVGTAGLPGAAGARRGGYHSEGYFSSDQDDETPRNRELKSPRSPRTPELRSPLSQTRGQVQRSSSQDSSKGVNLRMRTPSPESKGTYTMTLNESASFLIEKMMNNTPETKRKQGGKPEGRSCCKDGKKPTVAQVTGKAKTEKVCKQEEHSAPVEDADNVSETGTYTIEKDSSSPEVEQARQDIDRVFGVSGTESDADVALLARGTITATSVAAAIPSSTTVTSTAGVIHSSDETWNGTAESDKFKGPPSLSRSSPNWIQQWAAQVAEQTKSSTDKTAMAALGSPRGSKPPLASPTLRGLSTSQESSESRPRRILPTPPVHSAPYTLPSPSHSSPFTLPSPRGQEPSDQESPTKAGRTRGDIYDNLGKKSDSSLDTESYLRDTENLMTSLQARMDLAKTSPAGYRGSSFESHDSGGDSDLDTSTSYPISGTDERLSKVLKAKLKLGSSGDEGTKVSPVVASPRKLDPLALDTRLKMTSHFKRERSIMSDGGYEMYSSRREDHGLQSDSSSETSEPIKDARKASDNNPPLKFNRAFSLRRARLGCDDSSPSPQTPTAPEKKKKPVRPNSAGTISTSSRRTPTGVARNDAKNSSQTNKGSAAENFLRADGGRFSLRVPKSGSTTTASKSPSRATTKKEQSAAGRRGAPRSNSTLSAKEIDFQNWKRRKNYDPMKAAAEGRKKQGDKKPEKSGSTPPNVNVTTSDARSPSPPGSLLRSASFHGTVGLGMSATKWNRRPNHLNTSEDEAPLSLEEDHLAAPHASPLRRSPTSPHQMASPISASPAHHALNARARRSSYAHSEDGEGLHGTISRKASLDESGSEGKVSPMGTSRGPSSTSGRSKAKMEALDNLVISTIHSLSVKVRTTSENLLQKLKSQYDEEGDRAALLEAVLSHLSEGDQSLSASQSRSTSRELAGILQNLKKIGNALEVIDRVLILEDDDDLDDDDLEGTGAGDWSDRDY